jgi:hypothetical protein
MLAQRLPDGRLVVVQLVATWLSHGPDFGPPNVKMNFGAPVKWGVLEPKVASTTSDQTAGRTS